MTLWIAITVMCLIATLFVAWPFYRRQQRLSLLIGGSVIAIVALSAGLYAYQGSPGHSSDAGAQSDVEEMVASLAERLENNPDDIDGWKMLARSYSTLGDNNAAVLAYERVVEIEQSQNAQSLVDLGAAILIRDNAQIEGRTSALFESALAIEPNNPSALFYAGVGAFNRGNTELAADRWEILLGLNPPAEIRGMLEQRIAEWRGEPLPTVQAPTTERPGAVVRAELLVSAAAAQSLPAEATVFVIARDPAQPSPPIAVTRRMLSELPDVVELGDGDSMIPGRVLSAFAEFEIVARVSLSGQPIAQTGDWYAQALVRPAENDKITLSIEHQVP